jgi:hypothetical protein
VQGYHIARPGPAGETEAFMAAVLPAAALEA